MRSTVVLVTYAVAIAVGIVLGVWVAGLTHVECPYGLGNCLPVHSLSAWEAVLIGLAGSAAVVGAGIAVDTLLGRRRGV